MTKVAFFFAGTNDTAIDYYQRHGDDYTNFDAEDDIIKIYVDGCQVIGQSALHPDLETPTNRIKNAFIPSEDGQVKLDLARLKREFGDAVLIFKQHKGAKQADQYVEFPEDRESQCAINIDANDEEGIEEAPFIDKVVEAPVFHVEHLDSPEISVNAIIMTGFSRGAWTANLLLPKLDTLGVPLYCVSDQAVTGKRSHYFGGSITDCSTLKNLKRYVAFVGDYHKHTSGIERNWFYQSLPKLPTALYNAGRLVLFYLPHQDHFESSKGKLNVSPTNLGFVRKLNSEGTLPRQEQVSPVAAHLRYALEQCVNDKGVGQVESMSEDVISWYYRQFESGKRYYFTPQTSKLPVDGMDKNEGIKLLSDPCYFEALRRFVKNQLGTLNRLKAMDDISLEQASAIYHLFGDRLSDQIFSDPKMNLILSTIPGEEDQKGALIKILNEFGPICDYMRQDRQLLQVRGAQREQMCRAIDAYQHAVIDACYDYITSDQHNAAKIFGEKLIKAERALSSQLVDYPLLHYFFQAVRELIAATMRWGICYAKQTENLDLSSLKLPTYASAYVRVTNSQNEGENGLYYVNGMVATKLNIDQKAYDALGLTNGPLSKEQQSAISILTGFNPQRSSFSKRHRFFVPSPLEIIEYGAEQVVTNIKQVHDRIRKKLTPSESDNSSEIEMQPRKDTPGNMGG